MKRLLSAIALCASLLVLLILFLFPPIRAAAAKENVLLKLLELPAPPPPNPLVRGSKHRDEKFYDKKHPPDDNAPIEDLIDYWTHQGNNYQGALYYLPTPSDATLERLAREMVKKPELAIDLLRVLPDNKTAADTVKELYDSGTDGGVDKEQRRQMRDWLRLHSPYFSEDLERASQNIQDTNNYVSLNDESNLLALTRHDFDKAGPILNRLYNDSSQPVSKVLATWALYRHAMETNSLSDIERYRSELMRMVENRSLPDGVRDKANDALTHEPDFPGRDEWTLSLFEDETLVNMQRYSMLSTLIMYSPPEKYVPKMIALAEKASSPTVKAAAFHNLATALAREPGEELEIEIIKTLVPWIEDPSAASDESGFGLRTAVIRKLSDYTIPETVPGLIKLLNEKQTATRRAPLVAPDANVDVMPPAIAANAISPAINAIRGAVRLAPENSYPFRSAAVTALIKQKDSRAVPALRRVLNEVNGYERGNVVNAILVSKGFSIQEQMSALESMVKKVRDVSEGSTAANTYVKETVDVMYGSRSNEPLTPAVMNLLLGQQLIQATEISDELARAIVDRIEVLDKEDPRTAEAFRSMILKWGNTVINIMLLRDIKRDTADAATVVRLLGQRKELREKLASEVFDLQTGKPLAVGVAACLLDNIAGYDTILDSGDPETKAAMLACARLIRAPLPVAKVGENLKAPSQVLQTAAERYLESEDSPEAHAIVFARHPNEAKILGATSAFFVDGASEESNGYLWLLYQSLGDDSLYNGWGGSGNDDEIKKVEKDLQAEVKKDDELLGVYAYDRNYIRMYKDRVIFSWDEDESRYRERPLTKYEFEQIKAHLAANKVDELPPFLTCGGEYCLAKELIMLGRGGGRRVYTNGGGYGRGSRAASDFFSGLDRYFADLKTTKATLKYNLSRNIPGLEILLASDDLHAETVWKDGNDLRVAASEVAVRKKVEAELEKSDDEQEESANFSPAYIEETMRARTALENKHRYDGYAWYKIANGETAGTVPQPSPVEFLPLQDGLSVPPNEEQWKARAAGIEIRISDTGIFKVVGGNLTTLRKGNYHDAVITPNGRWAIAVKVEPEKGENIVRIDLVTGKEFPVAFQGYGNRLPVAYISTVNKFLIVSERYGYDGEYFGGDEEDAAPGDDDPDGMVLVDPGTGVIQPAAGEFRPLSQQTFRQLQPTSNANEFWAAIFDPKKNETQVGRYDIKTFGFKPVLSIPKIKFNSMSMWVDETAGKVYFVYRGHLLALPMNSASAAQR